MRKLPIFSPLPPMRCDDGCGKCCGIAPASPDEYRAVVRYARANNITPKKQGLTCPFYQGGTCAVYPVRPVMCRVFGHSEDLPCPHGYNTNVDQAIVDGMITAQGDPKEATMLHQALIDWGLATDMEDMLSGLPTALRALGVQ